MKTKAATAARVVGVNGMIRAMFATAIENLSVNIATQKREEEQIRLGRPLTEEEDKAIREWALDQAAKDSQELRAEAKRLADETKRLLLLKRKREHRRKVYASVAVVLLMLGLVAYFAARHWR